MINKHNITGDVQLHPKSISKHAKNSLLSFNILLICLFSISLLNYNVYVIFFSFIFLFLFVELFIAKFQARTFFVSFGIILIIVLLSFKFVITDFNKVADELSNFNFGFLLKLIVLVLIGFLLKTIIDNYSKEKLASIVRVLIIINFSVVVIQFVVYGLFGHYLDIHHLLTGEESRALLLNQGSVSVRYTGLYVEPSNLGAVALTLHCIYSKFKIWKLDMMTVLVAFMCLISLSTLVLVVCVFYFFTLFYLCSKHKLVSSILLVFIFIILASLYSDVLMFQYLKFEMNIGMRTSLIDLIVAREGWEKWFGYGPYAYEELIYQLTLPNAENRVASINDVGSLVFLIVMFGYSGCFVFLLLFWLMPDNKSKIFYLIISFLKISIYHPIFILFIVVLTSKGSESRNKRSWGFLPKKRSY